MFNIYFLLVVLPLVCNAQRTPSISYITQEQIKDIGGTVELECSVQYAQEYTVLWVKNTRERGDNTFLSTGSSLVIRDSRFALRYDPSSSTYTLQIKDIQETDAGNYQCQVILSVNNKIAADVLLSVRRPPVIADNSTQSLVVSEGKPVQMECYAGGYPHPTITWRRENNAILPTGMLFQSPLSIPIFTLFLLIAHLYEDLLYRTFNYQSMNTVQIWMFKRISLDLDLNLQMYTFYFILNVLYGHNGL